MTYLMVESTLDKEVSRPPSQKALIVMPSGQLEGQMYHLKFPIFVNIGGWEPNTYIHYTFGCPNILNKGELDWYFLNTT